MVTGHAARKVIRNWRQQCEVSRHRGGRVICLLKLVSLPLVFVMKTHIQTEPISTLQNKNLQLANRPWRSEIVHFHCERAPCNKLLTQKENRVFHIAPSPFLFNSQILTRASRRVSPNITSNVSKKDEHCGWIPICHSETLIWILCFTNHQRL